MNWIKTSDRLPDLGEEVLFFADDMVQIGSFVICVGPTAPGYTPTEETMLWRGSMENESKYFPDEVKYWMPLPQNPEEDEETDAGNP